MAQNLIPDPVEADTVIDLVQYLLRTVEDNCRDVVQYAFRLKELLLYNNALRKVNLLLASKPAYPLRCFGV